MGHPALSTASRGHAVVRSLGALGALLRMTRVRRVSATQEGQEMEWLSIFDFPNDYRISERRATALSSTT